MSYQRERDEFARGVCPDCRTAQLTRELLAHPDSRATLTDRVYTPVFGGDPRGAVLRLVPAGTPREDIDSGRERGIYVPARE